MSDNNSNVKSIVFVPQSADYWKYKINNLDWREILYYDIFNFTQEYMLGFQQQIREFLTYSQPFIMDIENFAVYKLEYDMEKNYDEYRINFYKPENFTNIEASTTKKKNFFENAFEKIDNIIKKGNKK